MPKIIYIPKFSPTPIGHGGNHRSYQIDHDLRHIVDDAQIIMLSFEDWLKKYLEVESSIGRSVFSLKRLIRKRIENPFKIFSKENFALFDSLPKPFLHEYLEIIRQEKPDIAIIENAGFYRLIKINRMNQIRSICAPQNLDSLDIVRLNAHGPIIDPVFTSDFSNEMRALSKFDDRLMISSVESGFVGGLGMSNRHYPYLPVGEVRSSLLDVRESRIEFKPDRNIFLMLGTVSHPTTRDAFTWFLEQAKRHGLPKAAKIIIAGLEADSLLPQNEHIPGIQIKGWLEQEELDSILAAARAVLIPQFRGFGSLTRLSELSCAGIPTIVSIHPTIAAGKPPGCVSLAKNWEEWIRVIEEFQGTDDTVPIEEYLEWEVNQSYPLNQMLHSA